MSVPARARASTCPCRREPERPRSGRSGPRSHNLLEPSAVVSTRVSQGHSRPGRALGRPPLGRGTRRPRAFRTWPMSGHMRSARMVVGKDAPHVRSDLRRLQELGVPRQSAWSTVDRGSSREHADGYEPADARAWSVARAHPRAMNARPAGLSRPQPPGGRRAARRRTASPPSQGPPRRRCRRHRLIPRRTALLEPQRGTAPRPR